MVQFITHYTDKYSYLDSVRIALDGGCQWIQLRMKETDANTLLEAVYSARIFAESLSELLKEYEN